MGTKRQVRAARAIQVRGAGDAMHQPSQTDARRTGSTTTQKKLLADKRVGTQSLKLTPATPRELRTSERSVKRAQNLPQLESFSLLFDEE
jgi:hypothetical protein